MFSVSIKLSVSDQYSTIGNVSSSLTVEGCRTLRHLSSMDSDVMDAEDTMQNEAGATASLSTNATAFCIASLIGARNGGECDDGPPPTTTEQDATISDSDDDDDGGGSESKMTSEVFCSNNDQHWPRKLDLLILLFIISHRLILFSLLLQSTQT